MYFISLIFKKKQYNGCVTSNEELFDPGVAFGLLQQTDPVMHFFRRVAVAVNHTVGRDDHKGVGPANSTKKKLLFRLTYHNIRYRKSNVM